MTAKTTKVILLNGTSSAGKTSIARQLQKRLGEPFLYVGIDTFEEMMPKPSEQFQFQPMFNRLLSGFHHSLRELARCGNNLIVDHVIVEREEPLNWLEECLTLLQEFEVTFVGVRCSLDQLKVREKARNDRPAGLAEWQSSRMHLETIYDLEVDTSTLSVEEGVRRILDALPHLYPEGAAKTLARLRQRPQSCYSGSLD